MSKLLKKRMACAVLALATANSAQAIVYDVSIDWENYLNWTGVVDTTTDTFTLTSWTTIEGRTFTPLADQFPITFTAQTATGSFDVADSWDGTIGSDWAFVSSMTLADVDWIESFYSSFSDLYLAWGGRAGLFAPFDYSDNEGRLGWVPTGAGLLTSPHNVVSVVTEAGAPSLPAVPTPTSFPLMATLLGGAGLFLRRRKKAR